MPSVPAVLPSVLAHELGHATQGDILDSDAQCQLGTPNANNNLMCGNLNHNGRKLTATQCATYSTLPAWYADQN